jgi:lipoprotein-anchoring transpeptidase ErfK/SrfK
MRKLSYAAGLVLAVLCAGGAEAARKAASKPAPAPLTAEAINAADLPTAPSDGKRIAPALIKVQVLLDRARFSPGSIDGRGGSNMEKALAAFAAAQGLQGDGKLSREVWDKLVATSAADPAVVEYKIAPEDVKGPFVKKIPRQFEEMAELDRLGYTSARELLAEKFHMTEDLLAAMNPGRDLDEEGTTILVPNVARPRDQGEKGRVAKIEVDKGGKLARAFDKEGKLVAFYPASIGSEEKPAPTGDSKVRAVALNPTYTYNPKYGFKGVKTKEKVTVKPGPNNPVGSAWIDLEIESYGIHGTPEPDRVGKSYSHGCIRLTNWDVQDLARMVQKGTVVQFLDP